MEQPQHLHRSTRLTLLSVGLLLVMQAIGLGFYIFTRLAESSLRANYGLSLWSVISLLAGFWLVIRAWQSSGKENVGQPILRKDALGRVSANLTLATLGATMQEGLALLRDGKIIYANNSLNYLLGTQEEDLLDTDIYQHIHPEDAGLLDLQPMPAPGHGNPGGQALPPEGPPAALPLPRRCTLRMATSLGDHRWVICNVHNIYWENAPATMIFFENLGPLKQAQRSLQEREQESRILLERTPLAIAVFDAVGQMKIANSLWYSFWSNVTGPSPRGFNILTEPLLPRPDLTRAIEQAFAKIPSAVKNLEHSTPWGETRWFDLGFHPMLSPTNNIMGVIMVQQDITDMTRSTRRQLELGAQLAEALRQLRERKLN
jgi:PAS domain-containing protein